MFFIFVCVRMHLRTFEFQKFPRNDTTNLRTGGMTNPIVGCGRALSRVLEHPRIKNPLHENKLLTVLADTILPEYDGTGTV